MMARALRPFFLTGSEAPERARGRTAGRTGGRDEVIQKYLEKYIVSRRADSADRSAGEDSKNCPRDRFDVHEYHVAITIYRSRETHEAPHGDLAAWLHLDFYFGRHSVSRVF